MKIPGYKLVREISSGPLTSVYLCIQESLDREVLLKILHPQHAGDKEIVERFIREAKLYAKLIHPNIVEVYDLGRQNGYFYIAMRYIHGWSLSDFINEFSPLPPEIAIYIIQKILIGLQFAHEAGIIHRDIKPSNILIGEDGAVKITDFGLAKPLNLPSITDHGTAIGTPAYMSPEIIKGSAANQLSDIFSAGATFYELLTGSAPFMGNTIAESIHKVLNKKPAEISTMRGDLPRWCDKLVMNMMDKNPQRRPHSFTLIMNSLESDIKQSGLQISEPDFIRFLRGPNVSKSKSTTDDKSTPEVKSKILIHVSIALIIGIISILVIFQIFYTKDSDIPPTLAHEQYKDIQKEQTLEPRQDQYSKIQHSDSNIDRIERLADRGILKNLAKQADLISDNKISGKIENLKNGFLFVSAVPWAEIYIDEKLLETTPLTQAIVLDSGQYKLELRNPGYEKHIQNITIVPQTTESLFVKLKSLVGFLEVNVIPWGDLYIDDKHIDTTPLKKPLAMNAGKYLITIKNPNFKSYSQEIFIKPGHTEQLAINLTQ